MPKLAYFIVSESVSTDQRTNRLSLFHILEEVQAHSFPTILLHLVATSGWNISEEEQGRDFQVLLRVHTPSGQSINDPGELAVNFTTDRRRHRVHQEIVGLPLREAGDFRFEILLNGTHQAEHIISVQLFPEGQ